MSLLDELSLGTSVDLSGYRTGFAQAGRMVDDFMADSTKKLEAFSIPAPTMGGSSGGAGADQAAAIGGAFADLAGQINLGLTRAMAPLNGFAARFAMQFDVVGSALVRSLQKADAAIRFPHLQAVLTQSREYLDRNFGEMEGRIGKFARTANSTLGGIQFASKIAHQFGQLRSIMRGGSELSKLGGLAPTLNFDNSVRSVTMLRQAASQATQTFRGLGSQVALSLGLFGAAYKATDFFQRGVGGAIELNDTLSKTRVIFGDSAGTIIAESDRMAAAFGTSKTEFVNAASGFGAVFKGLGKSQGDAAALGNQLAKLGMDLASFEGGTTTNAEAFGALSAALRGEFDPLERFRVFLSADAIAAEALAMGLVKSKKEIDESAKKTATLSLILKQTRDAQGDLNRTQSETSNQLKKLSGSASNFATSIGQAFLPAVDRGIALLANFSTTIGSTFGRNRGMIDGFVSNLARGFDVVGAIATRLAPSFLAIGSTIAGAFGLAGGAVAGFAPDLDTFVGFLETGLEHVNIALQQTIDFVRGIPAFIESAFGSGTISAVAGFAGQAGMIAALVPVVAAGVSLAATAFTALGAALVSPPALIGAVGAGFLYLTGNAFTLSDALGAVGFGIRNFGALGQIAFLKVGAFADDFMAHLAVIPENLGRVATFAATNWLELMQMPFNTLINTIGELGRAIVAFLKDPTQGFQFDFGKAFQSQKDLIAKVPELAKATAVNVQAAIDDVYAEIARKEAELGKKMANRPALVVPQPQVAAPPGAAQGAKPPLPGDEARKKQADALRPVVDKMLEAIKTPMEKFQETVTQLEQARDLGMLDQTQFDRSMDYARKEYAKDSKQSETPRMVAANQYGSREAYDQILRGISGGPMDAMMKVEKDQVTELKGLRADLRKPSVTVDAPAIKQAADALREIKGQFDKAIGNVGGLIVANF